MRRRLVLIATLGVLLVAGAAPRGYAAESQTLLTASSSGKPSKAKTKTFTVAGGWHIGWQFNCSKATVRDFHLAVFTSAGKRAGLADVHLRGKSNHGTQKYQVSGSYYLLIHSPCQWQVSVVGPKPAPTATPTATPEPKLFDVSGSGTYTTENFSAPATGWKVHYTYACKWGQVPGFFIEVGDARNPQRQPQPIFAETKVETGSGVTPALIGGQWFVKVQTFLDTGCDWHIWAPMNGS